MQQTTPGQGVVILRGLKGSEVLNVVDGFRLNNAIFRNAPNQCVTLVDSQSLSRIEIVRGPMSALYGSDAMGGVVQMLTQEPRFEGNEWQPDGLLRTLYGSADDSTLSRAQGAFGNERLVVSGGATYQDVNDRRAGGSPGATDPLGDDTVVGAAGGMAAPLRYSAAPLGPSPMRSGAANRQRPTSLTRGCRTPRRRRGFSSPRRQPKNEKGPTP